MNRMLVFVGLGVFTLACGGSGAPAGKTGGFSNAATLSGDPVGKGLDTPDKLTRVIPIQVSGAGITGITAVLGRQSATSEVYSFIAPVTNHGDRRRCFVQIVTLDLLDGTGATLGTKANTFLTGSVGKLKGGSMYSDACLDVGETGYLLELTTEPAYAAIASARITLKSSDSEWETPDAVVIPLSYSASTPDQSYTVTVANQGSVTATVTLSKVIYFDETDTPVYWNFLYTGAVTHSSPYTLAPGATYALNCDGGTGLWTGSSTKLQVFVSFDVRASTQAQLGSP